MAQQYEQTFTMVQQYLHSNEWVATVRAYVDEHCHKFRKSYEYTHEHREIFQRFTKLADETIESMLREACSCSPEEFVAILEKYADLEERGPTDASYKELVKTLLALDDFTTFAGLMEARAHEQGYTESEREQTGSTCSQAVKDSPKMPLGFSPPEQWKGLGDYNLRDPTWEAQVTAARAILDAYDAREVPAGDEIFVPWAQAVVDFHNGVEEKIEATRLAVRISRLLRERFRVDVLILHRTITQRRSDLVASLLSEGAEEKEADPLEQHSLVQGDISKAQEASDEYVGDGVTGSTVEELYELWRPKEWKDEAGIAAFCDTMYDALARRVPFSKHGVAMHIVERIELEKLLADIQRVYEEKVKGAPKAFTRGGDGSPAPMVPPVTPVGAVTDPFSYDITIEGSDGAVCNKPTSEVSVEAERAAEEGSGEAPPTEHEKEDAAPVLQPVPPKRKPRPMFRAPTVSIPAEQLSACPAGRTEGTMQALLEGGNEWTANLLLSPTAMGYLGRRTPVGGSKMSPPSGS